VDRQEMIAIVEEHLKAEARATWTRPSLFTPTTSSND
jgi:hypothetical protein